MASVRGTVGFLLGVGVVAGALVFLREPLGRRLGRDWGGGNVRLSTGDFPAGASAPIGDLFSVPLRPVRVGFSPSAACTTLLLVTGTGGSQGARLGSGGLLKSAYAMESTAVPLKNPREVRDALVLGGEAGGIDMGLLTVDRLADWVSGMRDAAPRTLLLVGRSRGEEALAAVGFADLTGLRGKRLVVERGAASGYFALWLLSRARLGASDVAWVETDSPLEASVVFREGRAEAAIGPLGDLEAATKERGASVLSTSADAPHLIASVLVARGDFVARYPDAVRRMIRALLDAATVTYREPLEAARSLGEVLPGFGDPSEAIRRFPPATLAENLQFFGLAGQAPVTYDELYESAAMLFVKLGDRRRPPPAPDTRDLSTLRTVAELKGSPP